MIDIHSHILPGVDDGAEDFEEALLMLKKSVERNTAQIILTPHTNTGVKDAPLHRIKEQYEALCQRVREVNIPVELALGMELYGDHDVEELLETNEVISLNGSRYVLLENDFRAEPEELIEMLELVAHLGKVPILAHAERFAAVQRYPELATEWNKRGFGLQINQGSLFGRFGAGEQKTAHVLLDHNLVQFIATDCHGAEVRSPGLSRAWDYIEKHYSKGYAELLMEINPGRVWRDEEILIINPRYPRMVGQ